MGRRGGEGGERNRPSDVRVGGRDGKEDTGWEVIKELSPVSSAPFGYCREVWIPQLPAEPGALEDLAG